MYNFNILSTDHNDLRQKAKKFSLEKIIPIINKIDEEDFFPKHLWPELGDLGLLGITASKEYGGQQLGYLAQTIVLEELSRFSPAIGMSYGAHSNLCINQIEKYGSKEQKEKYLPPLVKGMYVGAAAMSERSAGTDIMSMQTQAKKIGDKFIINGSKMWVTNGPDADVIIVYAKTKNTPHSGEITAFIIETNTPGFKVKTVLNKLGMRGSRTAELLFQDCEIPKENVIGSVGSGTRILMNGLNYERVILSGGPVGIMQACLDLIIPYTQERLQFKQTIDSFQLVQEKIANIYTALNASKAYLYNVASSYDQGIVSPELAASTYLFCAENATRATLETIQCLGGYGYLNECSAGRLLRDAKLYEIGGGTSEIRRVIIGRCFKKHSPYFV